MKKMCDKKRIVFSLVFLVVSCVLSVIALYIINYIPRVPDISAYDFFRSFMPDEEIIYNDDGELIWINPYMDSRYNINKLKLVDELTFPMPKSMISHDGRYFSPRQEEYVIVPDKANGLCLYFSVYDGDNRKLIPSLFPGEYEMYDLQVYLLKYLDGAWYRIYDSTSFFEYGQRTVFLCPADAVTILDENIYVYPIPEGEYYLALCDVHNDTVDCYGLTKFELVCDRGEDKYLYWNVENNVRIMFQDMDVQYHVENVEPTIYYDPYA